MTATLAQPGTTGPLDPDDSPRRLVRRATGGDRIFRGVLRMGGSAVLLVTGLIAIFLLVKGLGAVRRAGGGFFTTKTWVPQSNHFGIATLLPNGVFIALIALVIAVPVAIATAVFISEYARGRWQSTLIAFVDLMAAVPSIIYGLWGVNYLEPRMLGTFRWMSEHLSVIPIFTVRGQHGPTSFTSSTFLAGIVVSLMVIPLITSICREVYSQTPPGEREAAYALGASRWGMVRTVVLPFGKAGTIGAVMLGFGRAMGETIAIALIISPTSDLAWRVLENHGYSIAALIALRYQESTPEVLSSLVAAGLALFVVTLLVNAAASIIVTRSRSGAQTAG